MAAVDVQVYPGTTKLNDIANGRNVKEVKCAIIETAATAAQGDTYTFNIATLGGTTLMGQRTVYHDTDNSVLLTNAITTTVSGTTITFTIPAAGGTKKRVTKIFFI
jgi:hypothetical protein